MNLSMKTDIILLENRFDWKQNKPWQKITQRMCYSDGPIACSVRKDDIVLEIGTITIKSQDNDHGSYS